MDLTQVRLEVVVQFTEQGALAALFGRMESKTDAPSTSRKPFDTRNTVVRPAIGVTKAVSELSAALGEAAGAPKMEGDAPGPATAQPALNSMTPSGNALLQ